jgi:hypothetical protein
MLTEINGNLSLSAPSEAKSIPREFFDWVTFNTKKSLFHEKVLTSSCDISDSVLMTYFYHRRK